jgi:hypothetical protein
MSDEKVVLAPDVILIPAVTLLPSIVLELPDTEDSMVKLLVMVEKGEVVKVGVTGVVGAVVSKPS